MAPAENPSTIQCICGEEGEASRTRRCKMCRKKQHEKCTKYNRKLGPFYCAQCWIKRPLIKSKATLIVCPSSLIKQWQDEIKKHLRGDPKMFVYLGHSSTPIYPTKLQSFDIVLTTYSVLQNEFRLVDAQAVLTLRRPPKYATPGCSISNVHWWRLCLDEAQMVETPDCQVSSMAKCLRADHRWAITGTPVTRDVSDLYGLLDYLDIVPYNDPTTWNNLLYIPYRSGNAEPMLTFLEKILWRNAKSDVLDQICIPKQTVKVYNLKFSHVEKYYYDREHEHCTFLFLENVSKYEDQTRTLTSLNKSALKHFLAPLLSLRQACTHPHTSKGRYLTSRKQVNNMVELLEALIAKALVECEENLRVLLSAHNGVAGIHILRNEPKLAANEYRKALEIAEKYSKKVSVDKLQRIHMLHNLAYVLESYPVDSEFFEEATNDQNQSLEQAEDSSKLKSSTDLREECLKVENQYMERYLQQTQTAFNDARTASEQVDEVRAQFLLKPGVWFSKLIDFIDRYALDYDLVRRVANQGENIPANKAQAFNSSKSILYAVSVWNDRIYEMQMEFRDLLAEVVGGSQEKPTLNLRLVNDAMECHLRPDEEALKARKKKKKLCLLCVINNHMKKYESTVFNTAKRGNLVKENAEGEEISNIGNWKPSPEEILLKQIYQCAKASSKPFPDKEPSLQDGSKHLKLCFHLRKEFKALRKLWTYYNSQVQAQDELDICKIRLQLKQNVEPTDALPKQNQILRNLNYESRNPLENIHHLNYEELCYQLRQLESEKMQSFQTLLKGLGTQNYLQTLRKQQTSGETLDPCPICRNAFEDQYAILQCGHCYCFQCIDGMIEQNTINQAIVCCVCRQKHKIKTISYVKNNSLEDDSYVDKIKGDLSTKIEAIVRLIRDLKTEDGGVKVLVFSTWSLVLKVLSDALQLNSIQNELAQATTDLQKKLPRFKDAELPITALLLPLNLGSKGLNIIEATHVVFVEPVINPGDELQAVGRVHRIGQTRETTVHKFIVTDTIEVNIFRAISDRSDEWDRNRLTIAQLRDLFMDTAKSQ